MATVVLSHELYKDGMAFLNSRVKTIVADSSHLDEKLSLMQEADAVILRVGTIKGELMKACPNLKVIARPGVGVDTVDVKSATELGIAVVISPGTNLRSVAEHAVGLLYALSKNVLESHLETSQGNFGIRNKYAAIELKGKRLGILGFGNIGREAAKIFKNNEMEISVYDPFVDQSTVEALGYTYEPSLSSMLPDCDVISLHMPLTPETRGMLGREQFGKMKKGLLLINCARGDVIDEDALFDALSSGHLAGAAVDVMKQEPMNRDNKLFTLNNFIATPHMAALTQEGASRTSLLTAEGVLAVLGKQDWPYVYNPEALKHPRWK